jgi:hypothetical protein
MQLHHVASHGCDYCEHALQSLRHRINAATPSLKGRGLLTRSKPLFAIDWLRLVEKETSVLTDADTVIAYPGPEHMT